MRFPKPITLAEAAQLLGCTFHGDPNHLIKGLNEIHRVAPGDLTFSDVEKYFRKALDSPATTLLFNKAVEVPAGKGLLVSDDPFRDFNRLSTHFSPAPALDADYAPASMGGGCHIGRNVVFGEDVHLGHNVHIGHGVVLGSHVRIGNHTVLHANCTLYAHTTVGSHCVVHSGAVLGADAFYFKKRDWGRDKMISVGRTELGDYVEIGANCTVDRGVTDVTYIGHHTKLDNLVQVGHDVRIGQRCVIAAQVGIAGTSRVEDDVILWGQVGVATGLVVEKGAVVQAQSGLIHNVPSGKIYFGSPASEARAAWKRLAILEMMADRWQEIQALLDERTPGE